MKHTLFLMAAMMSVLMMSVAAGAAQLFTAPMIQTDDSGFDCAVTNVSATSRLITLDYLDGAGQVFASSGEISVALLNSFSLAAYGSASCVQCVCRITVKGGRRTVRGTARLRAPSPEPPYTVYETMPADFRRGRG